MNRKKGFSEIKRVESKTDIVGGEFTKFSDAELKMKKFMFSQFSGMLPACDEAWVNQKFVVMVFNKNFKFNNWDGDSKHIIVKPIDDKPIKNHWSVLQKIKNIVCGEEWTGIEVYPPVSNLIDEANLYHLWVFPEDFSLNFGLHLPGWFDK